MRQTPSPTDETHFLIRSLRIDYDARAVQAPHQHAWPQFVYALRGAVQIEIGGRRWITPPGRGFFVPAGQRHQLMMSSNLALRTLYLHPDLCADFDAPRGMTVTGLLREAILRICDQNWLDDRHAFDRHLSAVVTAELATAQRSDITLAMPVDDRARRLADRFLRADDRMAPLSVLVTESGLSRRTAERLFMQETGLSPAHWRRFAGLSESLVNLAGGMRIEDAATLAGYQSRSAFSDAFSKTFGFPPGETTPARPF